MSLINLGKRSMIDVLNGGQSISAHLNEVAQNEQMLTGAISCLIGALGALKTTGFVAKHSDPEIEAFLQSGVNVMYAKFALKLGAYDRPWLDKHLTALANAVSEQRAGRVFSISDAAPPPAEAQAVRVVGMPDRVTSSSVEYDAKGNITSTTQTEKDAPR